MPTTPVDTCPLCGLRSGNRPLLELHVREDHPQTPERQVAVPVPAGRAARPPRDHPEPDPASE
jgi:hypothetical protein